MMGRETARGRSRAYLLSLFGVNVALLLLLMALVAGAIMVERHQIVIHAERNVRNLTEVLAEQTQHSIRAIDQSLLGIAEILHVDHLTDDAEIERTYRLLRARQRVAPTGVLAYYVVGADGRLLNSSRTPRRELLDLSDRETFTAQRDSDEQHLIIGPAIRGRVGYAANRWIFNVSRRLTRSDGSFAGIIAAAISVDDISEFYESLNVGHNGAVVLFRRDGTLLARSPINEEIMGRNFASAHLFRDVLPYSQVGVTRSTYPSDGKIRLAGYHVVEGYPLVVTVGVSEREELAIWRRYAPLGGLAAFALAAAIFIILTIMQSRIRRAVREADTLSEAETRRKEELERYSRQLASLSDISVQISTATELSTMLQIITEKARELVGCHQAVTSLATGFDLAKAVHAVSVSEKYAGTKNNLAGGGLYRLVWETNAPLRLTQAELEAHPIWRGADDSGHQPRMRGWLSVPLTSRDRKKIGLIQLSDSNHGDFNATDEAILSQLARLASAAIESAQLIDELRRTQDQLVEAQSVANLGTWRWEIGSDTIALSPILQRIAGRDAVAEVSLEGVLSIIHPDDQAAVEDALKKAQQSGDLQQLDYRIVRPDGSVRYVWAEMQCEFDERNQPVALLGIVQDVTERKATEEQLRQAQKMEVVGQLTGGVAHDFNNLLMVIVGNLDLLLEKADPETAQLVNAAVAAAERGAALTRHLLAYARRQPLSPKEIDVNQTIGDISRLLRRTLGEPIEIETALGTDVWKALADPTQVESALLNLALNARDAMPTGGKLTIETANSSFDAEAGLDNDIAPGQYVMIAVSDTGVGMPPEIVARAFEPFFTTKAVGKGTGLGLSMVYGFAKQSGGHVKIYSEPGHGTTIKLFLPRAGGPALAHDESAATSQAPAANAETILVVEDDPLVRRTVKRMLDELGYNVLVAADGPEALRHLESGSHIDLLFTDVVLSGEMSGRALAERACQLRPDIVVLYSSGYTQDSIVHQGRLDEGVELLSKPYKKQDLAMRLRALLARRRQPSP